MLITFSFISELIEYLTGIYYICIYIILTKVCYNWKEIKDILENKNKNKKQKTSLHNPMCSHRYDSEICGIKF